MTTWIDIPLEWTPPTDGLRRNHLGMLARRVLEKETHWYTGNRPMQPPSLRYLRINGGSCPMLLRAIDSTVSSVVGLGGRASVRVYIKLSSGHAIALRKTLPGSHGGKVDYAVHRNWCIL